jgi:hypothetical protein
MSSALHLDAFPNARAFTAPAVVPDARTQLTPDLSGDVAYNGIHQWLAQTDHDKRMQWIASVEQIEALEPAIVVAGHKRPDARDDDPAAILGATKTYIRDFDDALAESESAQQLVDRMMVMHRPAADPRHLLGRAPRGERGRRPDRAHRRSDSPTRRGHLMTTRDRAPSSSVNQVV